MSADSSADSIDEDRKLIERIDAFGKRLTPKEVQFIEDMLARVQGGRELTPNQRAWAHRIDEERVA